MTITVSVNTNRLTNTTTTCAGTRGAAVSAQHTVPSYAVRGVLDFAHPAVSRRARRPQDYSFEARVARVEYGRLPSMNATSRHDPASRSSACASDSLDADFKRPVGIRSSARYYAHIGDR